MSGSLTAVQRQYIVTLTFTNRMKETGKTNNVFHTLYVTFEKFVAIIHKDLLPSSLHTRRSEHYCLNSNFSVQLNTCWHSSLFSLLFENSPLPLFNPLKESREETRKRETSIECWRGHNLPPLHTLFTVFLPAAIPSSLNGVIKNK